MNLEKFRHKQLRNKDYINGNVVKVNFRRFKKSLPEYRKKQLNLDTIEAALVLKYNLSGYF